MAYFGGIFFANMGGGGGQNYFHLHMIRRDIFWGDLRATFPAALGFVGHRGLTIVLGLRPSKKDIYQSRPDPAKNAPVKNTLSRIVA